MKAVVYEDVRTVRVGDVPDPVIEDPHDAVVRITTSAICGSDLHFYEGKAPLSPGDTIGHEGVGVVEEVGEEVERLAPGDRVVIAFDTVAVVGASPVGFFCVQAAQLHGAKAVLSLDMQPDRLALAEKVGAIPIDVRERNPQMAVSELTEGRGADVAIEAVGNISAYATAVD